MTTPAGTGPLALLDLPDPCVLGTGDDVAAYGLAARLLTPPDAPAEWSEPLPVACINLAAFVGSRLDERGRADIERQSNAVLGQDTRCASVAASITLDRAIGGNVVAIRCAVSAVGSSGPFSFVVSVDAVTAQILKGQ